IPRFNTIRMAMDYLGNSYAPAAREGRLLQANAAAGARELAGWKHKVTAAWPSVHGRLITDIPASITAGDRLTLEVAIHLDDLAPDDLVIECIRGTGNRDGDSNDTDRLLFHYVETDKQGEALYRCELIDIDGGCTISGLQQFRIRYYPCHHLLSHPFECGMMHWL
ncbi:MAG: hypothetical protein KJO66_06280, partial [Gammaproteobacteria bacterium]|nr:hypothetical protein [Gammaproteobacteria bacterium]